MTPTTSVDTKQRQAASVGGPSRPRVRRGAAGRRSSTDEQTPRFPPTAVLYMPLPHASRGRRYRVGRTRKPGSTSDLQLAVWWPHSAPPVRPSVRLSVSRQSTRWRHDALARLMSGRVSRRRWWVKTHAASRSRYAREAGGRHDRMKEMGSEADETHTSLITSWNWRAINQRTRRPAPAAAAAAAAEKMYGGRH